MPDLGGNLDNQLPPGKHEIIPVVDPVCSPSLPSTVSERNTSLESAVSDPCIMEESQAFDLPPGLKVYLHREFGGGIPVWTPIWLPPMLRRVDSEGGTRLGPLLIFSSTGFAPHESVALPIEEVWYVEALAVRAHVGN